MKICQDKNYNIGNNIRRIRNECEMTQSKVTIQLQLMGIDISRSFYSQIECGTLNIKVNELLALAKIFNVPVSEFFADLSV